MLGGTTGTETIISFPPDLGPSEQQNFAFIEGWTDPVLVNGSFWNVTVGPPANPSYSLDPFLSAGASLSIRGQQPSTPSLVLLVSGQDTNVPRTRAALSNVGPLL